MEILSSTEVCYMLSICWELGSWAGLLKGTAEAGTNHPPLSEGLVFVQGEQLHFI